MRNVHRSPAPDPAGWKLRLLWVAPGMNSPKLSPLGVLLGIWPVWEGHLIGWMESAIGPLLPIQTEAAEPLMRTQSQQFSFLPAIRPLSWSSHLNSQPLGFLFSAIILAQSVHFAQVFILESQFRFHSPVLQNCADFGLDAFHPQWRCHCVEFS